MKTKKIFNELMVAILFSLWTSLTVNAQVQQSSVNPPVLSGTSWKLEHVEWNVYDQGDGHLVLKKDFSSLDSIVQVHGWVPYALKFETDICVIRDSHGTESDRYMVMGGRLVIQRAGLVTLTATDDKGRAIVPPVMGPSFRVHTTDAGQLSLGSGKVFFNSQRQGGPRYAVYTAYYVNVQ